MENLWAPWRMPYIRQLTNDSGCFICSNAQNPQQDEQNLVLWRTEHCLVMLNTFPYNNGHLLISPARHIAELTEANEAELVELGVRNSEVGAKTVFHSALRVPRSEFRVLTPGPCTAATASEAGRRQPPCPPN